MSKDKGTQTKAHTARDAFEVCWRDVPKGPRGSIADAAAAWDRAARTLRTRGDDVHFEQEQATWDAWVDLIEQADLTGSKYDPRGPLCNGRLF